MPADGLSWSLLLAAAGLAVTHTLLGPDHYVPFLMLARARRWSPPSPSSCFPPAAVAGGLAAVTAVVYGILTVTFMAGIAWAGMSGLGLLRPGWLERWADALAGAAIAGSGAAIVGLGL